MNSKKFSVIDHEINYITNYRFIEAWALRQSISRAIDYISHNGGIEDCSALQAILSHYGDTSLCNAWERKWYYPAIYNDICLVVLCDEIIKPFATAETLEILRRLNTALEEQGAAERAER